MKKSGYFHTTVIAFAVLALVTVFTSPFILKSENWNYLNWLTTIVLPAIVGVCASCIASLWFCYLQEKDSKKKILRWEIYEQLTYYQGAIVQMSNILLSNKHDNIKKVELDQLLCKKFFVEYIDVEFKDLYGEKVRYIQEARSKINNLQTIDEHTITELAFDLALITDCVFKIQNEFFSQADKKRNVKKTKGDA